MARAKKNDFDKLQKDYLAKMLNDDKTWFSAESADNCYISDGCFIGVIPRSMCYLDCSHPEARHLSADSLAKMVADPKDLEPLTWTNKRLTLDNKRTAYILTNSAGEEIWIDEKYYKYFETMDLRILGTGSRAPVVLYNNYMDTVVGIILTINHN